MGGSDWLQCENQNVINFEIKWSLITITVGLLIIREGVVVGIIVKPGNGERKRGIGNGNYCEERCKTVNFKVRNIVRNITIATNTSRIHYLFCDRITSTVSGICN